VHRLGWFADQGGAGVLARAARQPEDVLWHSSGAGKSVGGGDKGVFVRADEYTCWQDGEFYLGYLNDYPEYQTQGMSKEELIANLQDLRNDIEMKDEYDFTDAEQGKFYRPLEELDIIP
jgi:hypothetical protein